MVRFGEEADLIDPNEAKLLKKHGLSITKTEDMFGIIIENKEGLKIIINVYDECDGEFNGFTSDLTIEEKGDKS